MSNFSINNINSQIPAGQGRMKKTADKGATINTSDSFKPSMKSVSSPVDLRAAAKLLGKKTEELPNVKWEFKGKDKSIFTTEPVFLKDGTMLIKSFDQNLYAIDTKTGAKKWETPTHSYSYNSPNVGPDGTIYTTINGEKTIGAIDSKTGKKLWEQDVQSPVYYHSPMLGPDGNLYVSNVAYGDLFAFDPKTGEKKKEFNVGRHSATLRGITDDGTAVMLKNSSIVVGIDTETGETKWEHSAGPEFGEVYSVFNSDGVLLSASRKGDLMAVDGNTGKVKWKYNTGSFRKDKSHYAPNAMVNRSLLRNDPLVAKPPVLGKDGTAYFFDDRGIVFAMDPDTGKPKWIYDCPSEISTEPMVSEKGDLFLGTEFREVIRLDGKTGKEKWHVRAKRYTRGKPLLSGDNTLFVNSEDGKTYRFNAEDGKQLLSYDSGGRDTKMATVPGNESYVMVADRNGRISCVGESKYFDAEKDAEEEMKARDEGTNLKIEQNEEFVEIGGVKLPVNKERKK